MFAKEIVERDREVLEFSGPPGLETCSVSQFGTQTPQFIERYPFFISANRGDRRSHMSLSEVGRGGDARVTRTCRWPGVGPSSKYFILEYTRFFSN